MNELDEVPFKLGQQKTKVRNWKHRDDADDAECGRWCRYPRWENRETCRNGEREREEVVGIAKCVWWFFG